MRKAVAAGPNLVVLHCEAGTAQKVGLAVDEVARSETIGTIAGDDTVFVAVASTAASHKLLDFFRSQLPQEEGKS